MTARFISYLEQKSYYIARDYDCIPPNDDERLAMTEIFDIIAGTDTGAIIAGSIAYNDPNSDEINYVSKAMNFFEEHGEEYYKARKLGAGWQIMITSIFSLFCGCICFCCLRNKYNPKPDYFNKIKEVQMFI